MNEKEQREHSLRMESEMFHAREKKEKEMEKMLNEWKKLNDTYSNYNTTEGCNLHPPAHAHGVCPHCGYCPYCGRGGHYTPYYPWTITWINS